MILVMGVSLYTSRIVLRELGVSDYGIYSLVGGFISLFGFLNAAMSSATQRYLSFDIGKRDHEKLRKTFSATLTIHIGIALFVLLLAESIGLWYVNNKMVFPSERSFAVNVVYQFSIATSLVGIIQVPYNALIIARERMNIFAYISIVEVLLKLAIVFMLIIFGSDKLIVYAILTFVVSLLIRLFYQIYCRRNYIESRYKFIWDKTYYKELISYSGWSLFGNMSNVTRSHGTNVLLNLFFGTIVNSAYGVAMQVRGATYSFVTNFQIASKPQIIQRYARNELGRFEDLIIRTCKFSFFLMYLISVPLLYNINYILELWLVEVPPFSSIFIFYSFISVMVDSISEPLITGIHASGRIKNYQIGLSIIFFSTLPISYFFLAAEYSPSVVFMVLIFINFCALVYRLFYCSLLTTLSKLNFIREIGIKIILVLVPSLITIGIYYSFLGSASNFVELSLNTSFLLLVNLTLFYFLGTSREEKHMINAYLRSQLGK